MCMHCASLQSSFSCPRCMMQSHAQATLWSCRCSRTSPLFLNVQPCWPAPAALSETCSAGYMDRNGDGWISASELSEALQDNGISVDAATIAALIAADFKGAPGSEPQISAAAFKVGCLHAGMCCTCTLGSTARPLWQLLEITAVVWGLRYSTLSSRPATCEHHDQVHEPCKSHKNQHSSWTYVPGTSTA